MQVLLFTLGEARCALALTALTRVLPAAALTPVPGAPACVAGLLDLHGAAVPVLDLVQLAGGGPGPIWRDSRILLLAVAPAALRAATQADSAAPADSAVQADSGVQAEAAVRAEAAAQTEAAAQAPVQAEAAERADAAAAGDQATPFVPAVNETHATSAAAHGPFAPPVGRLPDAAGAAIPPAPPAGNAAGAGTPPDAAASNVHVTPPAGIPAAADEAPRQLGLLAEHVLGVVRIDPEALADSGVARAPFVGRVVATADGLVQLIEPAGLLTPALRAALSWPEAA